MAFGAHAGAALMHRSTCFSLNLAEAGSNALLIETVVSIGVLD